MLDRLTDQARTAIIESRNAAGKLGHDTMDTSHLVLGLIATSGGVAAAALAELGVSEKAVLHHSVSQRPRRPGDRSSGHIPFTDELKRALEASLFEAIALGHSNLTTGHLLLGVTVLPDSVGAGALATLGVDAAMVRAALQSHHEVGSGGGTSGASERAEAALAQLRLEPPSTLPGWRSLLGGVTFTVAWYATTLAVIAAASWTDVGVGAAAVLIGVPALLVLYGMLPLPGYRVSKRLAVTAPGRVAVPDHLRAPLAERGITYLELRVRADMTVRDHCYRVGHRAWIVLSPRTLLSDQPLRFVLAHELAHLLRNDSRHRRVAIALYVGMFLGAVFSLDTTALAIAVVSALAHRIVTWWWAELSCDAVAIRWSGVDSLQAWAADRRSLLRQPLNRSLRRRLRRLPTLLTHPPMALRVALHPGAPRVT